MKKLAIKTKLKLVGAAAHGLAAAMSLVILLGGAQALAGRFQNAYVAFNLPDKWNCTLERTEWVCRTKDPGLADAIIILTAKEAGPTDSLANYESVLKTPRTIVTKSGQAIQSTVYDTKIRTIEGQPWIDSLHFSSEVYNYYTRYVVTKKDRVGVIVTFSAHKLQYTKYSQEFFNAIASLKVIATPVTTGRNMAGNDMSGPSATGDMQGPGSDDGRLVLDPVDGTSGGKVWLRIVAIVLLAAGAAWFVHSTAKHRNKKKKKSKSGSKAA